MNPIDMVIVVILAYCLIRGFFRGFIKELSSIVGVLGGFYAAYTYYIEAANYLERWISDSAYLNILSFVAVFGGVFIISSLLGVLIRYLLKIVFLGWVDKTLGVGFGVIKAVMIISVLLIPLTTFLSKGSPVIKNSKLSPYAISISEQMIAVVPDDMKKQFDLKIKELKKVWEKSDKIKENLNKVIQKK